MATAVTDKPSAPATARPPYKVQRSLAGRIRPQRDPPGRVRDARPHGAPRRVPRQAAARGREDHGLAAHDRADRRADRDAGGAGRRRALGVLQHLLDPGPRGRGRRGRAGRHRRKPAGHPGVRLEGRDAGGVLVVHRAGARLARRLGPEPARSTTAATRRCWSTRAPSSRAPARFRRSTPTSDPEEWGVILDLLRARVEAASGALDRGRARTPGRFRGDDHRACTGSTR